MISVIIPVYNRKELLKRCLESVQRQTYGEFEIILIDDGSNDGTEKLCEEFANNEKRIILIHQTNKGACKAKLRGIEEAKGEYICFIDSDDWIENNMFGDMVERLENDKKIDVVISAYYREESGEARKVFSDYSERILHGKEIVREMFFARMYNWSLCGKLYRRFLFENMNFNDIWTRDNGEDTLINWCVLGNVANAIYIPQVYYHYVMHEDSLTHDKDFSKQLVYLDVWNSILDRVDEDDVEMKHILARYIIEKGDILLKALILDDINENVELDPYRVIVKKAYELYSSKKNDTMNWRIRYLTRSRNDLISEINELKTQIIKMKRQKRNIYCYGVGKVFNDLKCLLGDEIGFDGYVVSTKQEDMSEEIISINTLAQENNPFFVIAVNVMNSGEVEKTLLSAGYKDYILAGRYSYYYM